jgi:hypothetical protein
MIEMYQYDYKCWKMELCIIAVYVCVGIPDILMVEIKRRCQYLGSGVPSEIEQESVEI